MPLFLAQTIPQTQAEGPGNRFALWVQGCSLRCPGCCNPEFFKFGGGEVVEPEQLASRVLDTPAIEGVSILGGEPFDQAKALLPFIQRVREAKLSVMVYSGYRLAELNAKPDPAVHHILAQIDLLVDGRFDRNQPESSRRWIGSANQQLHFLSDRYHVLDPQFWSENTLEIRFDGATVTVNGWPLGTSILQPKPRRRGILSV